MCYQYVYRARNYKNINHSEEIIVKYEKDIPIY